MRMKKKRPERERLQQSKIAARRNRRIWRCGIIGSILFFASVIPYAYDLFVHPNIWNAIRFIGLTIGGLVCIALIVLSELRKQT